ncbi:hypothetical protein F5887DRAFT_288402 [Amanita rubescens]|nr:hypothetical protein F5887DRAFT_288402 [Amanita rubescens]
MIGLDGIALVNVVANPDEAAITGKKLLQTKITHNDGSTWKSLSYPKLDLLGMEYDCFDASCTLHIHGYTERTDSRATYSSPSVVGLLMAVGNVGQSLGGLYCPPPIPIGVRSESEESYRSHIGIYYK